MHESKFFKYSSSISRVLTNFSVENLILQLARSGQIQKKVTEEELVKLLDQLSQQDNKTNRTKIVYERRQVQDDDDDDFFD